VLEFLYTLGLVLLMYLSGTEPRNLFSREDRRGIGWLAGFGTGLPSTLVATFYGMNFAVMPELAWEHGFTATIIQTLLAALLPLIYIKKKGWLR
jgi:hypothetical protein